MIPIQNHHIEQPIILDRILVGSICPKRRRYHMKKDDRQTCTCGAPTQTADHLFHNCTDSVIEHIWRQYANALDDLEQFALLEGPTILKNKCFRSTGIVNEDPTLIQIYNNMADIQDTKREDT